MQFKDYYQVMGLPRTATQDEVKRAYRKLARKFHPDVSKEPDAETRFKELGEAYEVLKDPEKRAAYDRLGANWKAGQDFRPPPDWNAGFEFSGGGPAGPGADFSDFFETLFGREFAGTRRPRGSFDIQGENRHARVLIDLEDAYAGATRTITLRIPELDGEGRMSMREHTLNVKIPRGILPGQQIRLAGQGGPGTGEGKAGDLYLEIEFRPHRWYRVEGRDVYLDLPVAPWEAVLGASVKAPAPGGAVELKIPPNSAADRKLRLKGRGIPASPPGDYYVVLQVALPPADSEAARATYARMGEQFRSFNPRAELGV
jgi:curved DNA-binding protein